VVQHHQEEGELHHTISKKKKKKKRKEKAYLSGVATVVRGWGFVVMGGMTFEGKKKGASLLFVCACRKEREGGKKGYCTVTL